MCKNPTGSVPISLAYLLRVVIYFPLYKYMDTTGHLDQKLARILVPWSGWCWIHS